MFNLIQQPSAAALSALPQQTAHSNKLPSFLSNHHSHNSNNNNNSSSSSSHPYNYNYAYNASPSPHNLSMPHIYLTNQHRHQCQFPTLNATAPAWSGAGASNLTPTSQTTAATQAFILSENSDDHFNRHIENLNKNDDENTSLICEEQEELNEAKLAKLIGGLNKSKKLDEDDGASGNKEAAVQSEADAAKSGSSRSHEEDETDEDYFCMPNDEQPKVFQDEDVDVVQSATVKGEREATQSLGRRTFLNTLATSF